jgi:ferredoxin-NADP reductase
MTNEEYKEMQRTAFGIRDSDGRLHISRKELRDFLPPGFPIIVTLCGSTRFKEQYEQAAKELTLQGKMVFSVGFFGHQEDGDGKTLDQRSETKIALDELHLRKIDCSDAIYVLNVGGYIGESTRREIEYAKKLGKKISYLEEQK